MEKVQDNQLVAKLILPELSQRLIKSLLAIEAGDKFGGKSQLTAVVSDLMPEGNPRFLEIIKYPKIADLAKTEGKGHIAKLIFILIRDFCASLNVVRNMNEDQIIEAAGMLLDECDNFRLEDYTMMFAMAKRGKLVKIYDRIDLSVITEIMDRYWIHRRKAAKEQEEKDSYMLENIGDSTKLLENLAPQQAKMMSAIEGLSGAIGAMKSKMQEWKEDEVLKEQVKKTQ